MPTHFSSFLSSPQFDRLEQANTLDAFLSFPFPFFFVFVRIQSFNPFLDDLSRNTLEKRWLTLTFGLSRGGWEVEEGFSILFHSSLKGGFHNSAHVHESKYFFALARFDESPFLN